MSTRRHRLNWRALRLYGGIVLATVVGMELLARIYDWTPPARDSHAGDRVGLSRYDYSPSGLGDLVPGQDGHWVTWFHRPHHVQTNSVGLRNAEEVSDTAFRILAVGDSQTFGVFLANEDTWPAWTELYLRRRDGTADRTQVLNAGMVGYTIVDELGYLKSKAVQLKPALVVLAVFENDMFDLLKEKNGMRKRPDGAAGSPVVSAIRKVGRNLALVGLADRLKTRLTFAAAGVDYRQGVRGATGWAAPMAEDPALAVRYTELFHETVRLLESHAIKLAVVFIPSANCMDPRVGSTMEPVIRAATAATGTPYLDLTPVLRVQPDPVSRLYLLQRDPSDRLIGDGHLSREGGAVIGRATADWLVQSGLTPNPHRVVSGK